MDDWVKRIRSKVGHDLIFVNSAGGWIEDDRGVLLQRRSATEELWGLPGGVMQLGESAEEAAIREVKEETGLDAAATSLIGVYTKFFLTCPNGDQCQTVTFLFRMRVTGGTLQVDGIETFDLRFHPPDTVPKLYSDQHQLMWRDGTSGGTGFFR